ncbi:hypothetical protein DM992_35835 [Burkholderia sp. JP2-270]|uniref:BON domain-containing protein n=1 Tax=Burkholderia sp. JP2-270 TaxID=2217913 RepID=UPI000DA29E17|nr:BON domain-containing protein [Burkholderia sp. JP2-270]AWV04715.1 hypothetical protein DM992_35835 [Burkholderia sp. JP2-270]
MKSDATLGRDVEQELSRDPAGAAIAIEAADGVVTLTGTVDSMAERRAACGAAWSVKGVREVVDRLTVS